MNDAQYLLDLKEKIDKSETRKAQLQGEREGRIRVIMQEFGCKSLKKAKSLLASGNEQLAEDREKLRKQMKVLEEKYEW